MSRPAGALERSLASLTIAIHQDREERRSALADAYTGEHFQQLHVDLSGLATATWGFSDEDVSFELPFLYAPAQRMVPFEVPHYTFGVEHKVTPSDLVLIDAHVLSWHVTEERWIVGAKVRFAVCAPNFSSAPPLASVTWEPERVGARVGAVDLTQGVPFNATAHLTFQGYATYAEGEEFDQ